MLKRSFFVTFFGVVFFSFSVVAVQADTIYSNSSTGNDTTGNGTSSSPYKTFHKAYTESADGDTIDLTGTFTWTNADETGDSVNTGYQIDKDLTIQGQSAGETIIQAADTAYTADRRLFYVNYQNVTFRDLTLRYGYMNVTNQNGSAIWARGNLTLLDCYVHHNKNHADRYINGAIFHGSGNFIMRDSTVADNENGYAGGLYLYGSTVEITNSTVYNNYGEYYGGVYYSASGVITITNSTIVNNRGLYSGGNLSIWGSSAQLYIKNTILADSQNTRNDFYRYSGSTVHDNGYNIVETQEYSDFVNGSNGTVTGDQANLNLDSALAVNTNSNGVPTLALLTGSIAINSGESSIANNGVSIPTNDQRDLPRVGTIDIGAFEFGSSSDSDEPVISDVEDSPSDTSAIVTWTTDEQASSLVEYGLVSTYGLTTSETNTSPRVTSHSVSLSSLKSCRRYYYRVKSSDAASNQAVSAQGEFNTIGCAVSTIDTGTETSITTASGGEFELSNNNSVAKLIVPDGFASEDADFQINKLDTSGLTSAPSGKALADDNAFDLSALTASDDDLTSFDRELTFTVTYGSDTEASFEESSLDVYRYNTGTSEWDDKNCTLDSEANTLTCSLNSFSTYAVFGEEKPSGSSSQSTSSSSPSPAGPPSCTDLPPSNAPDLFRIDRNGISATIYFAPATKMENYFVSYSTFQNAEEHGVYVQLGYDGVQVFTVDYLTPYQTYYFKVRAQNGCMPGEWSSILSNSSGTSTKFSQSSAQTLHDAGVGNVLGKTSSKRIKFNLPVLSGYKAGIINF